MKATDFHRAQGAILGKAMTRLEQGKDLVLILAIGSSLKKSPKER